MTDLGPGNWFPLALPLNPALGAPNPNLAPTVLGDGSLMVSDTDMRLVLAEVLRELREIKLLLLNQVSGEGPAPTDGGDDAGGEVP